jgi:hypothetical protein
MEIAAWAVAAFGLGVVAGSLVMGRASRTLGYWTARDEVAKRAGIEIDKARSIETMDAVYRTAYGEEPPE